MFQRGLGYIYLVWLQANAILQFKAMRQDGITKGVVNVDTEEREARAWDLGVARWRRGNKGN